MGDYGDIRLDDHWVPRGSQKAKPVVRITYTAEGKQK